eukprot:comp23965_c0_seq1/m.42471 comp23965_c0_seq1/g.42471  ORF comp23965_c0_seq1/g.42471 comp23965_c0_seq1/m.42471 type:complete len:530 (-) comp23965_c0_seq1:134-1723(-)
MDDLQDGSPGLSPAGEPGLPKKKMSAGGWEEEFEPEDFTQGLPETRGPLESMPSFRPRLASRGEADADSLAVASPTDSGPLSPSLRAVDRYLGNNNRRPVSPLSSPNMARVPRSPAAMQKMRLNDSFEDLGNPFSFDNEDTFSRQESTGLSKFELLQREIDELRRDRAQLEAALLEREKPPSVATTMHALWQNEYSIVELHRGLEEKLLLLDTALDWHDGDTVTHVLLLMRATLNYGIFREAVSTRPVALKHWIFYLESRGSWKELGELYGELGMQKEGLMHLYRQVFSITDPQSKMVVLQQCVEMCEKAPRPEELTFEKTMIEHHWALLVRQLPIEKHDAALEEEANDKFLLAHPRGGSLVGRSVVDTLYYCLFYHYLAPEDRLSSPVAIQKAFDVSEKQYVWTATEARAALRDWKTLQSLFVVKGSMFKPDYREVIIGHENLIYILARHKAPMQLVKLFLEDIKDKMQRYHVAVRVNCVPVVIQTLHEMKDSKGLAEYRDWLRKDPHPSDETLKFIRVLDECLAQYR